MPIALYTLITDAIVAVMASLSRRVVSHGAWGSIGKRARWLFQNMIQCAAARCAGKALFWGYKHGTTLFLLLGNERGKVYRIITVLL
ncbi:hypothetical protein [Candidatus Symbiopectobacterium sp. 'North America']|uniref:hypothetical protein n=1 Tax=Candidatus Symbiopectobacterium sp. 'North America' TaxID=2794574 RepID=UPI0018CA5EB0|nr:hypothetical protein [Candidatus Symbiopectobacterium sp. 'North America']